MPRFLSCSNARFVGPIIDRPHPTIFCTFGSHRSRFSFLHCRQAGRENHRDRCGSPPSARSHPPQKTDLSEMPDTHFLGTAIRAAGRLRAGDVARLPGYNAPPFSPNPHRNNPPPYGCESHENLYRYLPAVRKSLLQAKRIPFPDKSSHTRIAAAHRPLL